MFGESGAHHPGRWRRDGGLPEHMLDGDGTILGHCSGLVRPARSNHRDARGYREKASPRPACRHSQSVQLTDGEITEQHDRQPEGDDDVHHRRRGKQRDRPPPRLAQAPKRELQADRDEREDQEPGTKVVHRRDDGLYVACPLQVQRADDRRGDEAGHEFRNRSQNCPIVGRASSALRRSTFSAK